MEVIATSNLRKKYGRTEAVRGLDLKVPRGSICGFLGRNGAGKTTTIKLLMGMARPDGGEGSVLGHRIDTREGSLEIRKRTGFVSEEKSLVPYLTVEQMIRFTRWFYPSWRDDLEQEYLRRFELPLDRTVDQLAKGMRTKLAMLLAMARGAELLILDEPTEGLDPAMIEEVLQSLVALTAPEGTTIFFSSHQLAEVEQIADRVAIIEEGRLVVDDSIDALKESYRRVHMVFDGEAPEPVVALAGGARGQGRTLSVLASRNVEELVERARSCNARAIDVTPVTLKEIFMDNVRR